MLLHTIVRATLAERRRRGAHTTAELVHFSRFILTEIFPGGWLPTIPVVEEQSERAGFKVTRVQRFAAALREDAGHMGGGAGGRSGTRPSRSSRKEVYDRYMK